MITTKARALTQRTMVDDLLLDGKYVASCKHGMGVHIARVLNSHGVVDEDTYAALPHRVKLNLTCATNCVFGEALRAARIGHSQGV